MEILDLVEGEPGNGPLDKSDFMNLRRLRPRDKLANAQANPPSKYQPGIDNLMRGLGSCCRNPTASGRLMIV